MDEKAYSDKVIRETFRKYKTKFLERLPIETLPTRLECENIISGPERSIIQDRGSNVEQREKLLNILLTKDGSVLLKVLTILDTHECGYADLVKAFSDDMDAMQRDEDKKATKTPEVKKVKEGSHGETLRSKEAQMEHLELRKGPMAPYLKDESLESTRKQLGRGELSQDKDVVAMHAWKRDALLRHEDYLRISLKPNTILTRLVECGFMTEAERKSVEAKEGQDEQVGRMIEILRLKGNEEFGAFLKILEETGNASVASRLGKSAQQYKLEHDSHVQILIDNADEFLSKMNSRALAIKLKAKELIPEDVEYRITHATTRDDCNGILLSYLKEDATRERVLNIFEVASEKRSGSNMAEFAVMILEKMQQEGQLSQRVNSPTHRRRHSSAAASVPVEGDLPGSLHCCSQATCGCLNIAITVLVMALLVCLLWYPPGNASDTKHNQDSIGNACPICTIPNSSTGCSSHQSTSPPLQQERELQPGTTIMFPSMPCELQVVSSVLLNDTVYVTGFASDDVTISRQVQVLSLNNVSHNWSALPEAPTHNAPVTVINNRITLIGGRLKTTNQITNILCTWFEEEDQWKQILPPMPTRRLESSVCHHKNLLLVTGGVVDSIQEKKGKKEDTIVVKTVDVYNFSTKNWTTPEALQLPKPLRSPQVVVFEGNIYLMGGATTFPAPPEEGEDQYNPQAWRARWSDIEEAVNNAKFKQNTCTGGAEAGLQPSKSVQSVWKQIAAPPVLRPAVISWKKSLISVGGVKCGKPQKGIYQFVDKKADNYWIKVGHMSTGRYRHGVVPVGSHGKALFVAGGYVRSDPTGEEGNVRTKSVELVLL